MCALATARLHVCLRTLSKQGRSHLPDPVRTSHLASPLRQAPAASAVTGHRSPFAFVGASLGGILRPWGVDTLTPHLPITASSSPRSARACPVSPGPASCSPVVLPVSLSPFPARTDGSPSAGIGPTPLPRLQVGLEWNSSGVH